MTLCLVTDRRRLGAAVGALAPDWTQTLLRQLQGAVAGGIDLIQVREPDLEAGELSSLVRSAVDLASGTATKILVNDRLDVALAAGAGGVHLKESGFPVERARAIVPPGFLIGCSVHSATSVSARKNADYLIAGTVLPTVSKPSVESLNEEGLRAIVRAAAPLPVLGIGGLGTSSVALVAAAGATGFAAVGVFIPRSGEPLSEFVKKRVMELRFALESAAPRT